MKRVEQTTPEEAGAFGLIQGSSSPADGEGKAIRFHSSKEVAACLSRRRDEILREWDASARKELEAARHQSKPALYNEIPKFIKGIEDGLASRGREGCLHSSHEYRCMKAKSHGSERSRRPEYTLEQVLFEYHLLRDTIVDVLEGCRLRISPRDMSFIHASVDEAMGVAAQRFSDIRIGEEQISIARLETERDLRKRFVSTLTHDLRNPISAIRAAAELLLRLAGPGEDLTRIASRILGSANRTDQMIQDLLDANLIEAGQSLPIRLEPGDLRQVVEQAVEQQVFIRGDRFRVSGDPSVPGEWGLKEIRRAVENLLGNAIKYGDPRAPVLVKAWKRDDRALIAVHNSGNPIPEEIQESLFQQFKRSESAYRSGKKGWGLGLTLVRGAAEAHGGTVTVRSNAREGTTFTLSFPIRREARAS